MTVGLAWPLLSTAAWVPLSLLVLNEIHPDPAGADAGKEFVELLNASDEPADISGLEIQFANGAEGPVWRTQWQAPAGTVLPAWGRFLVADRPWAGSEPADAEADLSLQNGPDAVRLVDGDTVVDLVGYGLLNDPALFETEPVPLIPGLALARRPDGRDDDHNARDFVAAEPTPGQVNVRPWALALESVHWEPPSLDRPGDTAVLRLTVRNDGWQDWASAVLAVHAGGGEASVRLEGLAAGSAREAGFLVRPLTAGVVPVEVAIAPPGAPDTLAAAAGGLQVGPGPVVLNEVLGAPADGQGEWFELAAAADTAVALAGWSVRDEDGEWLALPDLVLGPGAPAVVVQDSAAFADWLRGAADAGAVLPCPWSDVLMRTRELPGWPALNNAPTSERVFADRLSLRSPDGVIVDYVVLGEPGGPDQAGRTLERTRVSAVGPLGRPWTVSTALLGGTPGCANSTAGRAGAAGALSADPPFLGPGGAMHLLFAIGEGAGAWRLRLYDLAGVLVRDFGGDTAGAGPRDMLWDGRDDDGRPVPTGAYVAVLQVAAGGGVASTRLLIGVR